jgi:hypothetical protein
MNKQQFLKSAKSLLKGIIKQRRWLLVNDKSHQESTWCKTELNNIEHALPRLVDADRAKAYLERKETALRYLIPTTNRKRHDELRELIETQLN